MDTKAELLLSDAQAFSDEAPFSRSVDSDHRKLNYVRDLYEVDRQKTRAVVQAMVNDMQDFVDRMDRGEARSKRSYAAFKHRIEVAKSDLNIEPDQP